MFQPKKLCAFLSMVILLMAMLPVSSAQAADLPDLVATDVYWSPADPKTGDQVSFTAVLKNQGTVSTPEGIVSAPVLFVDGNFVGYTDTYNKSIAPGESVHIPITAGPHAGNWVAQEGEHTVSILVDDVNRIPESNESNNNFVKSPKMTVITQQGADLVVKKVEWTPEAITPGQPVTLKATLENIGNEATSQETVHEVSFAVNGSVIAESHSFLGPLQPGSTVEVVAETGPDGSAQWDPSAGIHQLTVSADTEERIEETREDNNEHEIQLAVGVNRSEQAKMADSFVDTIGVNTHLYYYDTAYNKFDSIIKPKLIESGIRHIRDGAVDGEEFIRRVQELAASGISMTAGLDPRIASADQAVARIKNLSGAVIAVEGPNEYNIGGGEQWDTDLREYMRDIHSALRSDPATANLPIVGPTIVNNPADYAKLGDLSAYVDYGNMHPYPGGQYPSRNLDEQVQFLQPTYPGLPLYATETGYHNFPGCPNCQPGVSEEAEGKYLPRLFLEYFNKGIVRSFSYELIDEWADQPPTDAEKHFGLLRNDGTEKPAFASVKNLIGLLNDKGSDFIPGTLPYTLGGNITDLHHTLLQKRDGTYYLVLWLEKSSYDVQNKQDLTVPEQPVTLSFGEPIAKASLYRPATSAQPLRNELNPETLSVMVPDEPLVIQLKPGVSSVPGLPDLTVNQLEISNPSPEAGDELTFKATVTNSGNAPLSAGTPLRVSFEVDGETVLWSDTLTEQLEPGASLQAASNNGLDEALFWRATAGNHVVTAVADVLHAIEETNEVNNSKSEEILVSGTGTPDFVVTSVSHVPSAVESWDDVRFRATVKNIGTGPSPGDIQVSFQINGEKVAEGHTGPQSVAPGATVQVEAAGTWEAVGGSHTLTVSADDAEAVTELIETNNALQQPLTVNGDPIAAGNLPETWGSEDIGDFSIPGKAGFDPLTESFIMKASGSDIWNAVDGFRYTYVPMEGDGSMTAHVASFKVTGGWAKTGIMIRESMDPGSKHVAMLITGENGSAFQGRSETGGSSFNVSGPGAAPYWVRLERVGERFNGYVSADGVTWHHTGHADVSMPDQVYIGLALTSHDNSQLSTSRFDQITTTETELPDVTRPTAPSDLIAAVTDDAVELKWKPSEDNRGVTGYLVYDGSEVVGQTSGDAHFVLASLKPGTDYAFTVKARDAAGNISDASNQVHVQLKSEAQRIRDLIAEHTKSGKLQPALAKMIGNKVDQAEHFLIKKDVKQAVKHLEDLQKQLETQGPKGSDPEVCQRISEWTESWMNRLTQVN